MHRLVYLVATFELLPLSYRQASSDPKYQTTDIFLIVQKQMKRLRTWGTKAEIDSAVRHPTLVKIWSKNFQWTLTYKHLASQHFWKLPQYYNFLLSYTAWIPAELGITHWCVRCAAKHFYNKLKARYATKAKAPLNQTKMSSTVLFHEQLAGEVSFIVFHFIPLHQALSLTFPCLNLLWNSVDCMASKFNSENFTWTILPCFVNGINLRTYEYYQMNTRSSARKQKAIFSFQRNMLHWLHLKEAVPYCIAIPLHTALG